MLLAAYSFDESGDTCLDMSGNGNSFDLTAGAARAAGKAGGGLAPAGSTAVPMPDIGKTSERTVMLWFKGGTASDVWLIQWLDPVEGFGAWGIRHVGGNLGVRAANGSDFSDAQVTWTDSSTWHHIAGTYGGNVVTLYVDGVVADQKTLVGPITTATDAPSMLGWSTGDIVVDDLRIYDTALGASSIVAAMSTPVASGDLASAAELAVDTGFLARVKAAMQQYGVTRAKAIYASGSPSELAKAEFNLARACLEDPTSYAQQFAWALGSDTEVDATVDDTTIRAKVQAMWPIIAGSPF